MRLKNALGYLRDKQEGIQTGTVDLLFAAIEGLEQTLESISGLGRNRVFHRNSSLAYGPLRTLAKLVYPTSICSASAAVTGPSVESTGLFTSEQLGAEACAVLEHLTAQGIQVVQVKVTLAEGCMMKGPRAVMVMNAVDQLGDCMYCHPAASELEVGSFDGAFVLLVALRGASLEMLTNAIERISEVESVVSVDGKSEDRTQMNVSAARPDEDAVAVPKGTPRSGDSTRTSVEQTIRVPVERLDRLMNLLSELVIDKTRLASLSASIGQSDLKRLSEHMGGVSSDLQSTVMSLRMVPVDILFQRFPRMIRHFSKSLNKDIAFDMRGGDTELDRTVIDEMGEALVHLLRNAADHGLESTESRLAAGKSATGRLQLNAYPSGQHVLIEVTDDGQGIDVERVRAKAVERGLATTVVASSWTDEEVYQMLFASGFSTAEQVSDISGRGVGMDAVKMKVEQLGGTVYVQSKRGHGTTVTVQLPLTLSILQALLVRIGEEDYAIPLSGIEEVLVVDETDLETVQGEAFLHYRNRLVPIMDSGAWLNDQPVLCEYPWLLVVCKDGDRNIAIAIDDLQEPNKKLCTNR